jgi:hypothetical protein
MLRRLKFPSKKLFGGVKNLRSYNKQKEEFIEVQKPQSTLTKEELDEIRRSQSNYTKEELEKVIENLEKISEMPVSNMKYFWLWILSCALMGIIQYDNGGDEGGTRILFDKVSKMLKSSNKD